MIENLALVKPSLVFESAFIDMAKDFHTNGEERFIEAMNDFEAYVYSLNEHAQGRNLPDGFVPYQTFWMLKNGAELIADSRLRHELSPALEKEGGHIGYAVRPGERRKGYGTRLLRLLLDKSIEAGFSRVLVTCNRENTGSAKIITSNGGVYHGESISDHTNKPVSQYWINL